MAAGSVPGKTKAYVREGLLRPLQGARPPCLPPRQAGPLLAQGGVSGCADKPFAQARKLPAPSRPAARALCQLLFPVGQPSREAVQDIVSRKRAKQAPLPVADDLPPCLSGPQASLASPRPWHKREARAALPEARTVPHHLLPPCEPCLRGVPLLQPGPSPWKAALIPEGWAP